MERHWEMFLKLLGLSCAAASLCASVVSAERGRQAMVRGIQIDRMDARNSEFHLNLSQKKVLTGVGIFQ